jgi:hypothetical protein
VLKVRRAGEDLGQHAINIATKPVTRTASPPWHTDKPFGMLPRQCSKEFKVRVIGREVRRLLGIEPGKRGPTEKVVEQWMGISADEMQRMKDAEQKFVQNRWPLIELRMHRHDCVRWLERNGYPKPPKSACIFCPFHRAPQWRELRKSPEDWARAVEFDRQIRQGFLGMEGDAYVHSQRVPLDQADLSTPEDRGQLNMFEDECDGVCGV